LTRHDTIVSGNDLYAIYIHILYDTQKIGVLSHDFFHNFFSHEQNVFISLFFYMVCL